MSTDAFLKPDITLTQTDAKRLMLLAEENEGIMPAVVDVLYAELDRARVVPDDHIESNVIRMGSFARFSGISGPSRQIRLVYPGKADIARDRLSILTPIGVALIGLSKGQAMDWQTRDGRIQRLTVEAVTPPVEQDQT